MKKDILRNIDVKILKFLYDRKNDNNFYDISKIFNPNIRKLDIDKCVVELNGNNYVQKKVEGYLPKSAIPKGQDESMANNSICKISVNGIDYYEKFLLARKNSLLKIFSIFMSVIAIVISILTLFFK